MHESSGDGVIKYLILEFYVGNQMELADKTRKVADKMPEVADKIERYLKKVIKIDLMRGSTQILHGSSAESALKYLILEY